ncbi:VOC family protein [Yoonia sp. BS5-3]|uniref:VOC family protein n=1 Tax=Yoonia phaeophyticola TaxID=3137369 RepID=A0ABZ2V5N3_9RHOB
MPEQVPSPFKAIQRVDYTVIFVRDMAAMKGFYENIMQFTVTRTLSADWIEYQLGPNTLVLSRPGRTATDPPVPAQTAALQLAFKVGAEQVDACAAELEKKGVTIMSGPTDHAFGHRTVFFRDPDGNLLEIYAEI